MLADSTTARVVIVALVALSDIGGFFARRIRSHDRSSGQIVDPVTDKLFVLIALIAFAVRRDITVGQLFLLLTRDIYNTFAFFILKALHWKIEFKARMSGKTVTVLQLACVFALLFWRAAVGPLVWLTAAASVFAIQDYTRFALRRRKAEH